MQHIAPIQSTSMGRRLGGNGNPSHQHKKMSNSECHGALQSKVVANIIVNTCTKTFFENMAPCTVCVPECEYVLCADDDDGDGGGGVEKHLV